ncbi:endonuclease/exonuclease/phosphatase family protein [Sphingobacterium chuzhouense]|uniref:Endonuclease/exonuclease/phosphatase family protein n=1 Tax=Sphingobacterium chuzhouense TaxID=1742264 RepID=A0ABR7XNC0_9SPHI|nr:endonuclease/exonuclease/phosphatase family protein [Sphingobacterium chuzhouense]MBD1420670.1 endonuclease/exonuclease/phosphatase family protein [Sphingobacterium chuzhouense]
MARKSLFKKNLGFFSKTIFLCNMVAVLFLLLSYAASFINPKTAWLLPFFGLGYLPILIVNIGFVLYWLLRRPLYALFTLIPVLLGWNLLTQHVGFRSKVKDVGKNEQALRVMSFNAHLFNEVNEMPSTTIRDKVVSLIKNTDPDVLCIQEFFTKIKGTKQMSDRILAESGLQDYFFEPATKSEHEGYGQVIFSKYPIIHSGTITKNEYGINRITFADIVKDQDTIRVYNVHLRSFGLQTEDKEFIQNPSNTPSEDHATTRVGRKLKYAFERRSQQAEALRDHIVATHYPIIIMGDFNDTPMSYSVNLIGKGMKNTFQEKGQGWGVTHYEMLPLFQIDYIFCSPQFQVENYRIIKQELSDHYPLFADIRLTTQDQ